MKQKKIIIVLCVVIGLLLISIIYRSVQFENASATENLLKNYDIQIVDSDDVAATQLEKNDNEGIEILSENYVVFSKSFKIPIEAIKLTYYVVKKGDTVEKIAKSYNIDSALLKYNNPGIKNSKIYVGEKLKIVSENSIHYKILRRDTLSKISKKFGVNMDLIMDKNQMTNTHIKVGDYLFIPIHSTKNISIFYKKPQVTQKKQTILGVKTQWPVVWRGVTSKYGKRYHPVLKRYIFHKGVDLRASVGASVYAFAKGKVSFAGYMSGYGKLVIIKHSKGYETRYAHLNNIYVKKGQTVNLGKKIGRAGKTGRVTGPHLHFELRKNGVSQDPMKEFSNSTVK